MRFVSLLLAGALASSFVSGCDLLSDPKELLTFNVDTSLTIPGTLPIIYPSTEQIASLPLNSNGERVFELPALYLPAPALPADVAGGFIERVEINSVTLTIDDNTLDVPIEPIEIRIGTNVGNADFDTALPCAISDILPPGFEGEAEAQIIEQNRGAIGEAIANGTFGMGMKTQFVIPEGAQPAGGSADATFTIGLRFVVSPL